MQAVLKSMGMKPKGKSISKALASPVIFTSYQVCHFSQKDFKIMKQIFIQYDKDNSGTVTYKGHSLRSLIY